MGVVDRCVRLVYSSSSSARAWSTFRLVVIRRAVAGWEGCADLGVEYAYDSRDEVCSGSLSGTSSSSSGSFWLPVEEIDADLARDSDTDRCPLILMYGIVGGLEIEVVDDLFRLLDPGQ